MSALQKFIKWLDTYREIAFDLLRIYLGIGLFVRGVLFLYDTEAFTALLPASAGAWLASPGVIYAVALVHIVGGLMMTLGLFTRVAALAQIPILLGAVILTWGGLFSADQSFEFSALVLFLLVLIFLHGSGRWSVDHYWDHGKNAFKRLTPRFIAWEEHAFDLMRIYLGIGLFVRGVLFISDTETFRELLAPSADPWLTSAILIHYVALAHLFGGAMMAVGLLTRVAALIQIPILLGAVFLVHFQGGLLAASQSFEFSVMVLFLLIAVFLYGSGQWSADYYLFRRQVEEDDRVRSSMAAEILGREIPEEELFADPIGSLSGGATQTLTAPGIDLRRDHPLVVTEARYSAWGWFLFLVDVTPRPKEIIFRHAQTGEILERSRDPDVLERYRYH